MPPDAAVPSPPTNPQTNPPFQIQVMSTLFKHLRHCAKAHFSRLQVVLGLTALLRTPQVGICTYMYTRIGGGGLGVLIERTYLGKYIR